MNQTKPQTETQAFNSLAPEAREHPLYVYAFASPGMLERENTEETRELWLGPFCGVQVTYAMLRSNNTGNPILKQGAGEESDCWFTEDGRGPYSDFVITHDVPAWLDDLDADAPDNTQESCSSHEPTSHPANTPATEEADASPKSLAEITDHAAALVAELGGTIKVVIPDSQRNAIEHQGIVAWRRDHDDVAITHQYVLAADGDRGLLVHGDYAFADMTDDQLISRACARSCGWKPRTTQ